MQHFIDHPDQICVLKRPADDHEIWNIDSATPLVETLRDILFILRANPAGGISMSPESTIYLTVNIDTLKDVKGMKTLVKKIKKNTETTSKSFKRIWKKKKNVNQYAMKHSQQLKKELKQASQELC